MRLLGGLVSLILATVLGAFVFGFVGANVGDKNVGFNMAFWGAIAGNVLGLIGLAWFSIRRRDGMPLWGGITTAAVVYALFYYIFPSVIVSVLLAAVVGTLFLGVAVSLISQSGSENKKEHRVTMH